MYILLEWDDDYSFEVPRASWVRPLRWASSFTLEEARRVVRELQLRFDRYKISRVRSEAP